jgi:uncharacterized protein YfdQ (DUF2303 family)
MLSILRKEVAQKYSFATFNRGGVVGAKEWEGLGEEKLHILLRIFIDMDARLLVVLRIMQLITYILLAGTSLNTSGMIIA